jgi:hypothetical protein
MMIFALVSSLLMIVIGWIIQDYLIIAFGFIMGIRVRGMQKNHVLRSTLDDLEVNYLCTYDELSNRDYATIKNVLIERSAVLKKYMEFSNEDVNPLIASQVSSILIAPIKKDASLFFKITLIIFWFISFIAPIILYFLF